MSDNPPILLPDVSTFGDLFDYVGEWQRTENHERHNPANGAPRMIGDNEVGPFATVDLRQIGGEQHRSIAVRATDAVIEAVAPRIVTDDDHLSFRLIAHYDARVLVVLEHGHIIGSHWLAYIDPATIPAAGDVGDQAEDVEPFKKGDRVESKARDAAGVCTTDEQGRGDRTRIYAGSKGWTVRVLWDGADELEYDVPVPALRREAV